MYNSGETVDVEFIAGVYARIERAGGDFVDDTGLNVIQLRCGYAHTPHNRVSHRCRDGCMRIILLWRYG